MHPPQTPIPPFRADGEFRHTSWHMDFIYQLRGVSRADSELQVHFRDAAGELEFTSAAEIAGLGSWGARTCSSTTPASPTSTTRRNVPSSPQQVRTASTSTCATSSRRMRRFFLEFDDARSGGFAPLRFVPKGKQVVLGLVTTKSGTLEDKDVLKLRIDEAAQYVPLDQLCPSPQCGFSSTVEGNALSIDEGKAKLALIVETAAEVWG